MPRYSTRCSDCQHLDLTCEFSPRQPSLKRRQISKQIAAQLGRAGSDLHVLEGDGGGSDNGRDNNGRVSGTLKEGDCQLPLAGRGDMANKQLFQPRHAADDPSDGFPTASQQYWKDVHPFWPFVTAEMLEEDELRVDADLKNCIHLASLLSLNSITEAASLPSQTEVAVSILQQGRLSMTAIAGTLLVCPFIPYDDELLQRASSPLPVPSPPLLWTAID